MFQSLTRQFATKLTRVAAIGVSAALPLGGAFALSAPAAHADKCTELYAEMEFTGTHVAADKFRICEGGGVILLTVGIQQKDPATGLWKTVATGVGSAGYACKGNSPSKRYRLSGTTSAGVLLPCA
ncbi:hypothetical protein [Actinomadura rudentiformis]|uniref:Secreted protein n=1 Tax=Actinomadura rudentiformis TaxID=359158 RepID=A0A6H9Z7S8_9ACTN|nr:hypothetical protein [Actinomadura rudentiformis]KAB2352406.1 hypothetical protein F8566_01590 [Actinomadura rudentiformis]